MKAMKQNWEWVRQNPKARQAKSKARLNRFEELSNTEYQKRNETRRSSSRSARGASQRGSSNSKA